MQETIITIGTGLLLAAYAFIFNSQLKRIKALEDKPVCPIGNCKEKFDRIEKEQSDTQPILLDIQLKLARIETTLINFKTN